MTDWPIKTLGEVCDFVRGVTYDKADARTEMKSGFIPLLRATNITEKGLLREDFVFVPKNGVRADQKLMSGDALITIASGSASVVGRSVLVEDPGEMTFGAFCGVLRPSSEIFSRYLSHFMSSRSVRTAWSEAAQGTNINNLKRDDILQTECLLPPLEEQKRIVALLDAATARVRELSACYERARNHANNLFASALRDELEGNPDWPVETLGEVCELSTGGTPSTGNKSYYDGGQIKWLRSGDVHQREIHDCDGRITEEGMRNANTRFLPLNSVLIALAGQGKTRGTVAMLRTKATCNQSVVSIMPVDTKTLLPEFVFWNLHMKYDEIRRMTGDDGNDRRGLNMRLIRSMTVAIAPLEEQKQIVARLDSMRAKTSEMTAAYDSKLAAAKNLRQSILEAAFAGQL